MSLDRNEEVRRLFSELEELSDGLTRAERFAWLEERCAGDAALAEDVWTLHQGTHRQRGHLLEPPLIMTRPEALLGRELHEYRLEALLGVGGMGAVYRAFSKHGKRQVAIKVLHPSFVGEQENRRRFQLEVELIGKLSHPNIVRLLTAGEDAGLLWFAMNLIDGWSLEELLKRRRAGEPPPAGAPNVDRPVVAAEIMRGVANALACAHGEGVLHRDVKPGNLLLDRSGAVHLADFGLARVLDSESATLTGLVGGTCLYMSPEQARQLKDAVTAHSDIYSAGAVLYELLAGEPPFGLDGSPAVLRKIAEREVPALSRKRPQAAPGLALCAQKALRLTPAERYASAKELAEDLSRWIDGRPVLARSPSLFARARSLARSRRAVSIAGLGAALVTALAASVIIWLNARASDRADWAELSMRNQPLGALVGYEAYGVVPGGLLAEAAPAPMGSEWKARIPPGVVSVVLRTPNHPVREIKRLVQAKEQLSLEPKAVHGLPTSMQFINVQGGPFELVLRGERGEPHRFNLKIDDFQILQRPVTNAEFEQFLAESGRERKPEIQTGRMNQLPNGGVPGWADLPATGVEFELALEAAEWWGCHLQTRAQWELAMKTHGLVGQPPVGPDFGDLQSETSGRAGRANVDFKLYLERAQVRAASSDTENAELYLSNVKEWSISPALYFAEERVSMQPGMVYLCGVGLQHNGHYLDSSELKYAPTTFTSMPSSDLGFRLVRRQSVKK